jgi:hypothetical protein
MNSYETGIISMNSYNQQIHLINEFIETSTKLTLGTASAYSLLLEDAAPMLALKYWAVVIMQQTCWAL